MALKKEDLLKNQILAGLTPEQLTAIETMSVNDENNVVGTKFKETMDSVDAIISEATGKQKPPTTKTTDWLKSEFGSVVEKAKSVETLTSEVTTLKQQISAGAGDAVIKEQLKNAETQLQLKTQQLQAIEQEKAQIKQQYETEINQFKSEVERKDVMTAFQVAMSGKKFKVEENDGKELIDLKIGKFLESTIREVVKDPITGKETVIYRDKSSNSILLDPSNGNAPMTEEGWLRANASAIIDFGQKAAGAGTTPPSGGGTTAPMGDMPDWKTAKNKVQANKIIDDHLFAKGISTGDEKYQSMRDEIIDSAKDTYDALPTGIV